MSTPVNELYAPLLAAVMSSLALFGVTCSQTVYYFRTYPCDHRFLKVVITCLFLLEATHTILLAETTNHTYIISKLPENTSLVFLVTPGCASIITITVLVTSAVQSFYAWRIYRLSSGHSVRWLIVAFIFATSLAQLGSGLGASIRLYGYPLLETTRIGVWRDLYSACLVMSIICDMVISLSMVYFLNKLRSGFRSSENVINCLVLFSINVGLLTGAIAICSLISYLATPGLVFSGLNAISGTVYVNSMLVTLNSRVKSREMLQDSYEISFNDLRATEGHDTEPVAEIVLAKLDGA